MKTTHNILDTPIHFLMKAERNIKIYRYLVFKRNSFLPFAGNFLSLGKLVIYALIAVAIFHFLGIHVQNETLSFLQRNLFFQPLDAVVPVLLATAMFAVPQRIPVETLATIGISVIVTYLLTTLFSSSIGYGSVGLFDTGQYLRPLLSTDVQGSLKQFEIVPYAVVYSCAAAAVPSASIVLITAIYTLIGINPGITTQVLGLMIAVDWINDRVRTLVNVSGDLTAILLSLNERSPLQLALKLLRTQTRIDHSNR